MVPAEKPPEGAGAPYALENRLLYKEIFQFCPELKDRFLPFVSVDPVRKIREQLAALEELAAEYPVYGIKVSPVFCQSRLTGLLEEGEALLDFAGRRDLPVLLHVTVAPEEEFSQAADAFRVVERHPELRFCLAHCIGFNREYLEKADALPNVWVDTSALKIQVQAAHQGETFMAKPEERFDWDYSDHLSVMKSLVGAVPRHDPLGLRFPILHLHPPPEAGRGQLPAVRSQGHLRAGEGGPGRLATGAAAEGRLFEHGRLPVWRTVGP